MALNRVSKVDRWVKVSHVLISLSDKSNLDILVEGLLAVNPDVIFYSTGGTYSALQQLLGARAARNLVSVSDYTGQPEMQGGLVKTLDFRIYLGLLSETYNQAHVEDQKRLGAVNFDMVVVNLYPFQKTIAQAGVTLEDARANIDIGGPTMLRASAKNYLRVASVCDPADYTALVAELKKHHGRLDLATRLNLAKKTFAHTAQYDTAISGFLAADSTDLAKLYDYQDEEK